MQLRFELLSPSNIFIHIGQKSLFQDCCSATTLTLEESNQKAWLPCLSGISLCKKEQSLEWVDFGVWGEIWGLDWSYRSQGQNDMEQNVVEERETEFYFCLWHILQLLWQPKTAGAYCGLAWPYPSGPSALCYWENAWLWAFNYPKFNTNLGLWVEVI